MSVTRPSPRPRIKWALTSNLGALRAFAAGIHIANGLAHGVFPPEHSRTRA
ncbi:hypothetical protein ACAG25_10990 [Mycobacterium sp. pV006]|uniref:hypothetical protein n=1 Tax=Mycobacterium sp. pV006 TaxID=3238983 RepID=UPI00351BA7B4